MRPVGDPAAWNPRTTNGREDGGRKGDHLARPNHSYDKRRRELAKKQKQEQKRQRKLEKKNAPPADGADQSPDDAGPGA